MITKTVRNLVWLGGWLLVTLAAISGAVWAVIEHYLNAANGLELAGTETKPLSDDPLVGQVIGAFLPEATLPQAMAFTISLTEAIAFFMMAHQLLEVLELVRGRRVNRLNGDKAQVREATWRIVETLLVFAVLGGVLVWGLLWDIEIFRYRSMAGATGLDNPAEAAGTLPSWAVQLRDSWNWAVVPLTWIGGWGYLSFTAAASILLALCLQKLEEQFAWTMRPVDDWYESVMTGRVEDEQAPVFYGYDSKGNPVYDPDAPIAYDTNGKPVEDEEQPDAEPTSERTTTAHETNGNGNHAHVRQEPERGDAASTTIYAEPTAAHATQNGNGPHVASGGPLFDPATASSPLYGPARTTRDAASGERPPADLREVLGGTSGEQVGLAEAVAHPERYHVDLATGKVWNRKAWEYLHSVHAETESEGR